MLRVCLVGCCRTVFVCGAVGTASGSGLVLPNRNRPRAPPVAADAGAAALGADDPFALGFGALGFGALGFGALGFGAAVRAAPDFGAPVF